MQRQKRRASACTSRRADADRYPLQPMNQQRQTQRGAGESGAQTAQLQQTLMENGRKAMRQFFGLPIQQTLQFQRSAAELLMNGMEAQRWAQDQGVKLTRETMDNYLQTLDSVAQNAEELAQTGMATAQQQGQALQQTGSGFQGGGQEMTAQHPMAQQPQELGQQAAMGSFQEPQTMQQPQGMAQQPQGMGQQPAPQVQGIQQPLGQQAPVRGEPEQPTRQPEPTETTQRGSRAEGRRTGQGEDTGRSQQESLTETQ